MRILITGASKGIGAAIAAEVIKDATALILVARSKDLLSDVKEEIQGVNQQCDITTHVCDVAEESDVDKLMQDVETKHGGLDELVNCAGFAIPATSVQETTPEIWKEMFRVNVFSAYLMVRSSIPLLSSSSNPCIVNIGSTAGISARPGWSAYAASKAAMVNFSNTMAEELKPYGIRVHCLAPCRTATELRKVLAPDEDQSTIMQPDAVARVTRFLIGPDADVISGQTIQVRL